MFSAKHINVFIIFQDRKFNVTLANNFVKFLNNWGQVNNYGRPTSPESVSPSDIYIIAIRNIIIKENKKDTCGKY